MFHRPKFDRPDQVPDQRQDQAQDQSGQVQGDVAVQPVPGFDVNIYAGVPAVPGVPMPAQNTSNTPINATLNASEISERDDMQSDNSQPGNAQPENVQSENVMTSPNMPSMHGAEEQQVRHGVALGFEAADEAPSMVQETLNPHIAPQQPAYMGGIGISAVQSVDVETGRELIVGKGISLTGEIQECNNLVVEGRVEAALKGAKILEIREEGTFIGAVEIEQATIAGVFEGEITVNGRLTITKTGSITGTIAYKELEIHAGATVEGKIAPVSAPKFKSASTKDGAKDDQAEKSSANKKASSKPRQEVELPL